jgi:hypothetical protein
VLGLLTALLRLSAENPNGFVCLQALACLLNSFLPSLSRGDNPQPKMMMVIELCKLKVLWVVFSNLHGLQLLPEDGKLVLLLIPYFSADADAAAKFCRQQDYMGFNRNNLQLSQVEDWSVSKH